MDGYEVYTSDGGKAGTVVGTLDDALVVETGTIFKARHLLPLAFAEVDESEGVVRSSLSKEMIVDSPKFDGDDIDTNAVLAHYGLVGTEVGAPTTGAGVANTDDPASSADQHLTREGLEPTEAERAKTRERLTVPDWTPGPSGGPIVGGEGDVERD